MELYDTTNPINSGIQPILGENKKDFNYSDLSIKDLANMKMPYINCNRKIFCNTMFDLIDLFNSSDSFDLIDVETIDLKKELFSGPDCLFNKAFYAKCAINRLIFHLRNHDQQPCNSTFITSTNKQLNDEFVLLLDKIKTNYLKSKLKCDIYRFL